ncbi:3517_t:CDS:10 [Diversispora eburnea]|uniref:3517_t:CDS:1 n=1 Tax=Diversispora eburnea TaxID=1213867 RepID=A0A9N9BNA8_9GLOM|nr:3517_t:CDS:10 [Diversispora eburnea]
MDFYRTKVANSDPGFDLAGGSKARNILDNRKSNTSNTSLSISNDTLIFLCFVKSWTATVKNFKKDLEQVKIDRLQINQLSTGDGTTYNNCHIISEKHCRDAGDDEKKKTEGAAIPAKKCKTESENRTRIGRTVVPNYGHFYFGSVTNEDSDTSENSSQGSFSSLDKLNDELAIQENDHFDKNQEIQNDDQKSLTLTSSIIETDVIVNNSSQETDDDEDIPPEDSFLSASSGPKVWILPSGQNVGDIYASKISENARATKKKKKLTAIEKAILRYGASNIIDLSAHMKEWFCIDDRKFIIKDYESMLRIPEMATEESSFLVRKGKIDQAHEYCMDTHVKSEKNSFLYKMSKIYGDFIYKSEDQVNILNVILESTHTEIDVILKACACMVEGPSKNLKGESFCPLSRSTDYTKGRKCDVRFISALGVDVGEWEFSAKAIANKSIGERCHSARINQSILNGLLEFEDLMEIFYFVFPGPKFELPIRLRDIGKLKTAINVIKLVMVDSISVIEKFISPIYFNMICCADMYEKTCETIENLETFHHDFDDIFDEDYHVDKLTHFKRRYRNRTPPPTYREVTPMSSRREFTTNQKNRSAFSARRIPSERDEDSNRIM